MGQLIAKTDSFVSAPLHSPVSGVVEEVGTIMHPTGQMVPGIILQNNGLDELDDSIKPKGTLEDLSAEDIISTIKNAGIVGMGGASFPTHVKLSCPRIKKLIAVL